MEERGKRRERRKIEEKEGGVDSVLSGFLTLCITAFESASWLSFYQDRLIPHSDLFMCWLYTGSAQVNR